MSKLEFKSSESLTVFGCDVNDLKEMIDTIIGDTIRIGDSCEISLSADAVNWIVKNAEYVSDKSCLIDNAGLLIYMFNSESDDIKSNVSEKSSSTIERVVEYCYSSGLATQTNRFEIIRSMLKSIDYIISGDDELTADALSDIFINVVALSEINIFSIEHLVESKIKKRDE